MLFMHSGPVRSPDGSEGGEPSPSQDPAQTNGKDPAGKGEGAGTDDQDPKKEGDFPSNWEEVFKHPRFKELTADRQALKEELDQLKQAREDEAAAALKAEADRLKKDQKWEELATQNENRAETAEKENKKLKEQLKIYQKATQAQIEQRLASFPEPLQKLLTPLLDGREPADQLTVLADQAETIEALIGDNGKPATPRGTPATPTGQTDAQKQAERDQARKEYQRTIRRHM